MTDGPRSLIEEIAHRASLKQQERRKAPPEIRPAPFLNTLEHRAGSQSPAWSLDASGQPLDWWPGDGDVHSLGGAAHLEEVYEQVYKEAQDEGHKAGLVAGADEARQEAEVELSAQVAELEQARLNLEEATRQVEEVRRELMKAGEEDVVALALKIGRRLAADAQIASTDWISPLVREAIQALTDDDNVVCFLSPDLDTRLREAEISGDFSYEVNNELKPLGIAVEGRYGRVDASFDERFDNLARAVQEALATVSLSEPIDALVEPETVSVSDPEPSVEGESDPEADSGDNDGSDS